MSTPKLADLETSAPAALAHAGPDSVGVAVRDLQPGDPITIHLLNGSSLSSLKAKTAIPLGHKIALRDLRRGENVIEYGQIIGEATADIPAGSHVHIHNLRSRRWPGAGEKA